MRLGMSFLSSSKPAGSLSFALRAKKGVRRGQPLICAMWEASDPPGLLTTNTCASPLPSPARLGKPELDLVDAVERRKCLSEARWCPFAPWPAKNRRSGSANAKLEFSPLPALHGHNAPIHMPFENRAFVEVEGNISACCRLRMSCGGSDECGKKSNDGGGVWPHNFASDGLVVKRRGDRPTML